MNGSLLKFTALSSPVIWFLNHTAQFALAPLACVWQSNVILWVVGAIALALDVVCGFAAWTSLQHAREGPPEEAPMPPWLAMSAVALSVSFFLIIAAQMIPPIVLAGCA